MNKDSKKKFTKPEEYTRFTTRMSKSNKKELRIIAALSGETMTKFVDTAIRNEINRRAKR